MVRLLHTPMVHLCYNRRSSFTVGAPQSPLALLSLNWCFDISFSAPYSLFCPRSSSRMGVPQSPPRPRLGVPLFHSTLLASLPFRHCSAWMGWSAGYTLLNSRWRSLAWICTLQFHLILLHQHQHSPGPSCTPRQALLLSLWHTSVPLEFVILPFKLLYNSPRANVDSNVSDITNRAKRHWNSISYTRQVRIIRQYKQLLQLLCAVNELYVPAFVSPDGMGDFVDDIETMFD